MGRQRQTQRRERTRAFSVPDIKGIIRSVRDSADELESICGEVGKTPERSVRIDGAGEIDTAVVLLKRFASRIKVDLARLPAESTA